MFDFLTFHHRTEAVFLPALPPDTEPDFISPSKSVYWNTQQGVIRASDHWVGRDGCEAQASCRWELQDDPGGPGWRSGYCAYAQFRPRRRTTALIDPTTRDSAIAAWLLDKGGACTPQEWAASGFGTPPAWLHRVPRGSIAATAAADRLFATQAGLSHALCARSPALDAALAAQPVPWW